MAGPRGTCADELHDLLRRVGDLRPGEFDPGFAETLIRERRAIRLRFGATDLLVAADMELDRTLDPVLPRGDWGEVRAFNRDERGQRDPDLPRMFQRPGSIVPMGRVMQRVDETPLDTLEVLVCLDDRGRASGRLYEDAGDGQGHARGEYRWTEMTAELEQGQVRVHAHKYSGEWALLSRPFRVTVVERPGRRPANRSR